MLDISFFGHKSALKQNLIKYSLWGMSNFGRTSFLSPHVYLLAQNRHVLGLSLQLKHSLITGKNRGQTNS